MIRSKWTALLMAGILSISSIGMPVFAAESGMAEELPDEIIEEPEETIVDSDLAGIEESGEVESPDEFTSEDDTDYWIENESSEQADDPYFESGEEIESADEVGIDPEGEAVTDQGYEENDSAIYDGLTAVLDDSAQSYLPYEDDQTSPDDLFSQYVNEIMEIPEEKGDYATDGLSGAASKKKYALSNLTSIERAIYDYISSEVPKIASGERTSTIFEIPVSEMGFEQMYWSAGELGVDSIMADEMISQEAADALLQKGIYDLGKVIGQLLVDQPYYMYWFDKTIDSDSSPYEAEAIYDEEKGEYLLGFSGSVRIYCPVVDDYSAGEYLVDETTGQTVRKAAENAKDIVSLYSSNSDYEKLDGYREKICNLTSYNYDALGEDVCYGNPWQLIWVFDGDPNTNVVCEGYAKAFQYLCDLSTFSEGISCITVTGTMTGGTGEGLHMWNIVRMEDGNNYLVDLTNCDEEMIGESNLLFLAGISDGTWETGYMFICNGETITYAYDEEIMRLFPQEKLQISTQHYAGESDVITQGNLRFEITGSKAKVVGYVGTPVDIVIPASVNGVPVTSIGGTAFDRCVSLRSIDIPSSVVSIDDGNFIIADNYEFGPFFECKNLEKVVLHEGLEHIGYLAFRFCEKLSEIELPESLNFVAPLTFSNCKSLTSIQIPRNLHYISSGMFDACWNLEEISLHENIEVLSEGAFNDCKSLKHITLHEGLKEIGEACFSTCYSLEEIEIPDSVVYIGNGAFNSCTAIKRIDIPEGITCINDKTFAGMDELLEVNLPSSLESLGNNVFSYSQKIHEITIPANVSVIGSRCFEGCNELRKIVFEGALPTVEDDFLYDFIGIIHYPEEKSHWSTEDYRDYEGHPVWCANGKEKNIFLSGECSTSVQWKLSCDGELIISGIGDMPNYNTPQDLPWSQYLYLITELTIDEGVSSICDYCVMATRELKEVTLPKSLKRIGAYSFSGTRSLTRIILPELLESIGKKAFEDSHIETIIIPSSVNDLEEGVFANCQYLREILTQENNHYVVEDDILYSEDYSVLIACLPFKEGPVNLNDNVQKIGDSAFYSCKKITEVNMPGSVSEIKDFAFCGCESLKKINLNQVALMEQAVFQGCNQLQDVVLSNCIETIPIHAFSGCDNIRKITVPQSVRSIQYNAFGSYEPNIETTVLFEGNLPEIDNGFINRRLIVNYPQGISSWDARETYFSEETVFIGYEHKDHIWDEETVTKEPTCTEPGVKRYTCSLCGENMTEEIPALGHAWNESYSIDIPANCTTEGSMSIHCSQCDAMKDIEAIPASGHQFGEWLTIESGSCEGAGTKQRICSVCNFIETEKLNPEGHIWEGDYTVDKLATCTEAGSKSIHCSKCEAVKDSEVIPATGHNYSEWLQTKAPTCTESGSRERICATCNEKETEVIPPLSHEWNEEFTIDKPATCTEPGSQSIHCKVCGDTKDVTEIPATGHQFGEWETVSPGNRSSVWRMGDSIIWHL